jgi:cytidine diphosphoramidate kinase
MKNVIWITGLSAAGKTTLAKGVTKSLIDLGYPTIMLDGDILKECFNVEDHNTREDRQKRAYTYSKIARMLARQGVIVVVGTIALFKEIHYWNRENIPGYFEVFLDIPLDILRKRDPKGLYRRFDHGEIKDVAGLDISVDFPKNPDLSIKYKKEDTPDITSNRILEEFLKRKNNEM